MGNKIILFIRWLRAEAPKGIEWDLSAEEMYSYVVFMRSVGTAPTAPDTFLKAFGFAHKLLDLDCGLKQDLNNT